MTTFGNDSLKGEIISYLLRSRARVEFFDYCLETAFFDVGVDLRGRDVRVAEQFLNDAEVGAAAEEVCGEAVTHEVGIDIRIDAGAGGVLFDELADAGCRELFSPDGEENFGAGFFGDEFGAFALQVSADCLTSGLAEGDEAGLFSLAGDSNERGVEVDVFEPRVAEFGNAEPAGVEQLKDCPVSEAEWIIRADAFDQLPHLLDMQGFGKMLLGAR